ncbi:MAG: hypothetical protein R2796_02595 [Chitinophagaceae bacterium]|nr:hypothetical protein [Chitinophagaceae bacterium]HQU56537.1 hypothetical protein [Chitinophagaceae bacterium]HQV06247.1 hypothetical protein [Chitinophagaceae bacterium]
MKKLVIVLVAGLLSIQLMANTNTDINEKVKASFKATFPNAQSVKWHENGNTFTVSFIRNSIDHRVEYDTEGNIIQTTRFYGEQNLPAYLLAQVKKRFEGKKIHIVTELSSDAGMEFHITLHDAKKWYLVKAYANGMMEVYDQFKKQKS